MTLGQQNLRPVERLFVKRSFCTLLACLSIPGILAGQSFEFSLVTNSVGHSGNALATGDLDGDSDPDLIVSGGGELTVFFNDGQGNLSLPANDDGSGSVLADMDGDSDLDLVSVSFTTGNIQVYKNNGNGSFELFSNKNTSTTNLSGLIAIDVDGDQDVDVVTTSQSSGTQQPGSAMVLMNQGDGLLADAVSYSVGQVPYGVESSDVDADGHVDLIVWNSSLDANQNISAGTVSVLRNNGDGTFFTFPEFSTGGIGSLTLAIGDINGDSIDDLVTANSTSADLSVMLGNNDGTFAAPYLISFTAGVVQALKMGDFDGDSDLDLVVACSDIRSVAFLANEGDGNFVFDTSIEFEDTPISLTVDDLDANGKDDVIVGFDGDGEIVTIFSDCSTLTGDINGDGIVDILDITPFVDLMVDGEFIPEADINGDGLVDLSDIQPFIDLMSGQ